MKDVLIIGKTGRLGKEFVYQLGPHKVTAIGRTEVDLTDLKKLEFFLKQNPHRVVINCAALNGIEACLKSPGEAFIINSVAPAVMADAVASYGGLFVHFSTDYAITGEGHPRAWKESESGTPCSLYGLSKRQGEEGVIECAENFLIFRVASIYGDDLGGSLSPVKNFLANKRALTDNKVLHQQTTPTSVRTIVRVVREVIRIFLKRGHAVSGLYHLASMVPVYKHDFARVALKLYLDEDAPQILCGQLPIQRPVYSCLDTSKIKTTFSLTLPTVWDDLYESARLWRLKTNRPPLPPCTQFSPKLA
jgi:dTDP-4-dehydrorhamnose reductase